MAWPKKGSVPKSTNPLAMPKPAMSIDKPLMLGVKPPGKGGGGKKPGWGK